MRFQKWLLLMIRNNISYKKNVNSKKSIGKKNELNQKVRLKFLDWVIKRLPIMIQTFQGLRK